MQQHALLEDVKSHFDHWRTTRTKHGKIPGHLWDKVKSIMEYYPLTVITNTLRLNTNQIRENLTIESAINFVEAKTEVIPLMVNQSITSLSKDNQTCSIELHCINGGVIKITALPIASLSAIISQFIG
jgi:hypothetical protein